MNHVNRPLSGWPCTYVLTLPGDHADRRASSASQLQSLPLPWSYEEGFDSADTCVARDYDPQANRARTKRPMTGGEIAVYLGHRQIWQRLIREEHEYALVLEDDFEILSVDKFLNAIADAVAIRQRWDILKFFDFIPKKVFGTLQHQQTTFAYHRYPASGAVAYLINRDTAERLLTRPKIFRPIDEDFSNAWEWGDGLRIFSVVPNPVAEISERLGGSILSPERERSRQENRSLSRSVRGNVPVIPKTNSFVSLGSVDAREAA